MRLAASRTSGSILVWAILIISILSLVAAELLQVISSKYFNAMHTASWQETLLGAESGVDLAIIELRKSLYPANTAWSSWSSNPTSGGTSYGKTLVPNAGLGGTEMTVEVNVDAPPQLKNATNGWQYYRVRSVGTLPISGPRRSEESKGDTHLRKISLQADRFATGPNNWILSPHQLATDETARVSRRVEAIVRPVSAFDEAIMSVGQLDLTDQDIIIDSYDSRDSTKSTNGLYDPNKSEENGNIATDGQIINAGNAHVHGDVATNSGTVTGVANVTGEQRTDFYQEPIPVSAPSWPSINPSPMLVNGSANLAGNSTEGSPASRYVLSSITMSGTDVLTLTGNADGSPSYIEIYISGAVSVTGNAQVVLAPGVKAKIYFSGNFSIAGNGVVNTNNQPGDLLFYGVNPTDGSPRTFALGGNSLLSAAVYAPAFDVEINNGGTRGSVFGSFIGKTVKMNGVTDLHYDEALGSGGTINNYKIVSWVEDTR